VAIYFGSLRLGNNNIEKFREELTIVKKESLNTGAIQDISNKFENWTKNLLDNKEQKEIEWKKKNLSFEEKRLKTNKEFREYYNYILESLKNSIIYYNKETNNFIRFDFDSLPLDVLSNEIYEYESYFLTKKYLWKIAFCCKGKNSEIDLPFLYIDSKLISNISGLDTISKIRLLKKGTRYEDEFRISIFNYPKYFKWHISQQYGNINYKIIEDTEIKHTEFYNKIDEVLFEIMEYILLN